VSKLDTVRIIPFTAAFHRQLEAHLRRHRNESGRNGLHFMPFTPDDCSGQRFYRLDRSESVRQQRAGVFPLRALGFVEVGVLRDRHPGYAMGQRLRKRIEQRIGWA